MKLSQQSLVSLRSLGIEFDGEERIVLTGSEALNVSYMLGPRSSSTSVPRAVLLDMDGTSLISEQFWVRMLDETVRYVTKSDVGLSSSDKLSVQGATTRDHLAFLKRSLGLDIGLQDLVSAYDIVVEDAFYNHDVGTLAREISLQAGFADVRSTAFALGIPFLLVTNGNMRKADIETRIIAHHLELDDVAAVSTGVWCAPRQEGWLKAFGGSLGKPHPWPYLEAATKGAGIETKDLGSVIAVDDSAAGVCSIRLAGLKTVGLAGGNISAMGAEVFCDELAESLYDVCGFLK